MSYSFNLNKGIRAGIFFLIFLLSPRDLGSNNNKDNLLNVDSLRKARFAPGRYIPLLSLGGGAR